MLTKQDLQSIGGVVREEIRTETPKIVHEVVGQIIEEVVNPQFDTIHKELEGIHEEIDVMRADIVDVKRTMISKDYMEGRLASFARASI